MKKKVLFLINDLNAGGAEKALVNIVNNLDHSRYEITCKTLFDKGINRNFLSKNVKYKYFMKFLIRGYSYLVKFIPARLLYKIVVKEEYDLEIAFLEGVSTKIISGSCNKKSKKLAWIHTEFTSSKIFSQGFLNEKFARDAYSKFDCVVAVSKDVQKAFKKYSKTRTTVLYNPLIINNSSDNKTSFEFDNNFLNFVTVGRLNKVKGFERLIECFSKVCRKYNVKLYIIGEGEERTNLERKIKELDLQNNVELMGYINNPLNIVSKADLFICSSYREGYSTAVNEAIAVGTPVLTTKCSGMEELLLGGKLGLIVENDTNSLLKGIEMVLENPEILRNYKNEIKNYNKLYSNREKMSLISNFIERMSG